MYRTFESGGNTMEFLELAKKRFSVRQFSDKKVEPEKLGKVLEAGRVAPTAVNKQPQRILVLNNEESLNLVKKCTKYHFDAPIILMVCYDSDEGWKNPYSGDDCSIVDATIITTHMMLEAADLGLGSTFVGHFDPQALREQFKLPDNIIPVALLPLGYPKEGLEPSRAHSKRKPIEKTVFYNSFD